MTEILITKEEIRAKVKAIAAQISTDYKGKTITLLCTLKGAAIFMADLAREIDGEVELEFIKVSSYGENSFSTGNIIVECPASDISGKHVIVVEDIVDMGYTAQWLMGYLKSQNPASLALCALLDKPDRRKAENVAIDYLGFTIPDKFVVGYGLDYAQKHRNLPYIGVIDLAT